LENRATGRECDPLPPAPPAATSAEPAVTPPPFERLTDDLTVGEVALRWIEDIERTIPNYRRNSKWNAAIVAAAAVSEARTMPAKEFGPRALLHVQRRLVETPAFQRPTKKGEPPRPVKMRSRRYVNDIVARVRQKFEWAMLHELVPEDRVVALGRVPATRAARCRAGLHTLTSSGPDQ